MRYLVATDGSEESKAAVRYATTHALAFDAEIELVHVLIPKTQTVEQTAVFEGEDAMMDTGERILSESADVVAEVAEDHGRSVEVETTLLTGRPAHAIAARAERADATAIYVGHRGLANDRQAVVGSVAKGVVDRAEVPVTIVR